MDIRNRLFLILIAIFIVVMIGSNGYFLLFRGEQRFMECMYMTIISLTGVGYGEIIPVTGNLSAEIFTMILITFGMGIIFYGISTLTVLMVEGELSGILRQKRMEKKIRKLNNHYIVCGGGETGRPLIEELIKNTETVVLIEQDQDKAVQCQAISELLYVAGDATLDHHLAAAGIEKAAGIATCLPSDKDNLYITMTARMMNPTIRIVSRMTDFNLEPKLRKAGADCVVSPNAIGALRMASEMIRPTVVNFLDHMLRSQKGALRIHEIAIPRHSGMVGKRIIESGIKDKYNLLILGSKVEDRDIDFNPSPDYKIEKNSIIIVMGEMADIQRAKKAFSAG